MTHDLHDGIDRRRIKVMEAQKTGRVIDRFRQAVHSQAAGVRRHNSVGAQVRVQAAIQIGLQIETFENRLHDQIRLPGQGDVRAAREMRFGLTSLGFAHAAFFGISVEEAADRHQGAINRLLRDIDHADIDTALCDVCGNAGAHGSGSDDGDGLEGHH